MKYFQIGFNKCATLSLHELFTNNNIDSIHYDFGGIAREIKKNVKNKSKPLLGKYERYNFLCDMEFICDWEHPDKGVTYAFKEYFKNLDEEYPGSKFILNTRSIGKWLKSRKNHAGGQYIDRYKSLYNCSDDEVFAMWTREWYEHHANVVNYFAGRPEALLILDLDMGIEVCQHKLKVFLGEGINCSYFGHIHKTKQRAIGSNTMDIITEEEVVSKYLESFTVEDEPVMLQIGANDGVFEHAKLDGKDFVFEFLLNNSHWQAILVEPLSSIFKDLKSNYKNHGNRLAFLNCAITETVEKKQLTIAGAQGKRSTFMSIPKHIEDKVSGEEMVQCISYPFMCDILGLNKIDFVKVDTEGYDEIIVRTILDNKTLDLKPKILLWESLGPNDDNKDTFEKYVESKAYTVFLTGLNRGNNYMDRVAILTSIL